MSPRASSTVNRVSALFYTNTRIWDPRCLKSSFYLWEAEMVSKIHVSEAWAEDLLIWPLTLDDDFSVRSVICWPLMRQTLI